MNVKAGTMCFILFGVRLWPLPKPQLSGARLSVDFDLPSHDAGRCLVSWYVASSSFEQPSPLSPEIQCFLRAVLAWQLPNTKQKAQLKACRLLQAGEVGHERHWEGAF